MTGGSPFSMRASVFFAMLSVWLCLATKTQAAPMTFEFVGNGGNCDQCEWIAATGVIEPDTAEKFAAQFGGTTFGTVVLDSPGGNLKAAVELGRLIRKSNLKTVVAASEVRPGTTFYEQKPGHCLSACAFTVLGGVERDVSPGSKVGVHQFFNSEGLFDPTEKAYTPLDFSELQRISADILQYVVDMGAEAGFMTLVGRNAPRTMHILSEDELVDLRVSWDPNAFTPWTIEMDGEGLIAVSRSRDETRREVVFCLRGRGQFMMTQWPADEWGYLATVIEDQSHLKLLGMTIDRERVVVRTDEDKLSFIAPFEGTPRPEEAAFGGLYFMESSLELGRRSYWVAPFNADNFDQAYRLAVNEANCIG
ncbi:COG3904 family protein [Jiella marina]|uniref:COG3904 family protein n=1 Tax=Jiella sp. LLJ827 TaxID=2917712 RepID=UPI00210120D3|nr:hypothetical protein [Jiella sp. LLJ827]MCQ0987379.1 hypothetical protein [Jiella sp. LLJ827]